MKKLISTVLLFAMVLSLLAGCTIAPAVNGEGLENARKYVISYFQGSSEVTDVDYTVIGSVPVDGVTYSITWSTDNENVKVVPQDNGMVLIDVPELASEVVTYVLTATIADGNGNTTTYSVTRKISAAAGVGKTDEDIVKEAYELAKDTEMEGTATLTGVVKSIRIPYDAGYQNITVIIQVGNLADMPIDCYRLKGDGVADLAPGDTVTVQGVLKNHNGTVQFNSGSVATKIVKGPAVSCPATAAEILAAAKALEKGWALPYKSSLTGVVTEITSAYDATYLNLTCNITVDGNTIICYRLFGALGENLKVGDTITVTGYLMNYKGDLEYGQGCTLDSIVPGEGGGEEQPTTPPAPNPTMGVVDAPVVGVPYKFGMIQPNLSTTDVYYICGGMAATYYLATNTSVSSALDVYLEEADGGYYMYAMVGGVKTYINAVVSGTHVNAKYQDAPATVYTYDAELKTVKFPATVEGEDGWYIFGNKNGTSYTTIGCYNLTGSPYYCQFYAEESGSTACAHEGGTATCTEKAVCTKCGESYGTLADHAYVDGACSACGAAEPQGPVADTLITLEQANTIGKAQAHNTYTTDKYYVEGVVTEVYNAQYGNMYIKNEAGTVFTVYGLYLNGTRYDAMTSKPVAGDKIKVYGAVGQYNGTAQIKNGELVSFEALHTHTYSDATCTVAPTCACGAVNGEALGHADADKDHKCDNGCTEIQGVHADGDDEDLLCDYGCGVEISTGAKTEYTVSKTLNELATAAGKATSNGTVIDKTVLTMDENVTVVCAQGKAGTAPTLYYGAVRLYQNGATMTVNAGVGTQIKTIVLTLDSASAGQGPISVSGGTASALSGGKYTITVDEGASEIVITTTGADKNSRVYVASIEVTYEK